MPAARAASVSLIESPTKAARPPPARRIASWTGAGSGLRCQRIPADDRGEAVLPAERGNQAERQSLKLVGADRKFHALCIERVERGLDAIERLGVIGDMIFIIADKQRKSLLDQRIVHFARRRQPLAQQGARAMAHHAPHIVGGNRGAAKLAEGMVERCGQIERGVRQRPVEIEHDHIEWNLPHGARRRAGLAGGEGGDENHGGNRHPILIAATGYKRATAGMERPGGTWQSAAP